MSDLAGFSPCLLERFSNFYVEFVASFKVAFTSTPSSKDHSLGAPEMKKPLKNLLKNPVP